MKRGMRLQQQQRNAKGSGLAEVAVACTILVAMALFALDIGTAMICFNLNDRACRDAARAAANGQNQIEATNLATQILKSYNNTGKPLVSDPQLIGVRYTDFNGNPPDGVSPFVTVTTRMNVRSIAPLKVGGLEAIKASFPVTKSYTFPIVKLRVTQTTSQG